MIYGNTQSLFYAINSTSKSKSETWVIKGINHVTRWFTPLFAERDGFYTTLPSSVTRWYSSAVFKHFRLFCTKNGAELAQDLTLKLEAFHLHNKSRHCEVLLVWFYLSRFVYSPRCFCRIGSKTRQTYTKSAQTNPIIDKKWVNLSRLINKEILVHWWMEKIMFLRKHSWH